jgi:hypothetical protein
MLRPLAVFCVLSVAFLAADGVAAEVTAGYAQADVTPDVNGKTPVFIAGYGQNRRATGVHDPLYVRAMVVSDGTKKVAMAAVDVVGLQYPTVQEIRKRLSGFDYVLVSSTHNHEGPDVVGIWGPTPFKSGVDPAYIESIVAKTVETIQNADKARGPVTATYGTAVDGTLMRDSREPYLKDDVIRVVKFDNVAKADADKGGDKKPRFLLVNWTCHPEALASENTEITADFPYYTVRDLEKKYGCPVLYISGAVGGLMAPPRGIYQKADGSPLDDGNFEYCERLGGDVAKLAMKAIEAGQPVKLAPIKLAAKPISVPLENKLYRAAQLMGVLKREGLLWTGNPDEMGRKYTPADIKQNKLPAGVTEVGYLGLGEVHVAAIPGEIYPELVYGKVQDPVDPGADFPDAAVEPAVLETLPGKNMILAGLANDELGYIVPKRQWDEKPPFCYGRTGDQYGEGNSCGPDMAKYLLEALKARVQEAK